MTTPKDNERIKYLREQVRDVEAELDKLTDRQWKLPEGHQTRESYLSNINTLNDQAGSLRAEIAREQERLKAEAKRREANSNRRSGLILAAIGVLVAVATAGSGWMWAGVGVVLLGVLTIATATT